MQLFLILKESVRFVLLRMDESEPAEHRNILFLTGLDILNTEHSWVIISRKNCGPY